ncbi:MAG: hypothetical protein NTZ98_00415 [Acidobacteria bacterium]|nr:hypothetical protein [Acidobacteriota bacterium]
MTDTVSKTGHDEIVRRSALLLMMRGYEVRARIEDWFEPPDVICGYRPDILATRANSFLIVEVEKGPTDWPKICALRAFKNGHADYRLVVIPLAAQYDNERLSAAIGG